MSGKKKKKTQKTKAAFINQLTYNTEKMIFKFK